MMVRRRGRRSLTIRKGNYLVMNDQGPPLATKRVALLDPSINSANVGDQIIRRAVDRELASIAPLGASLPTQTRMSRAHALEAAAADYAIVGGTNLLSSNMPWYMQWKLDPRSIRALHRKAVLMGVGWWQYQGEPNAFTRSLLRRVLATDVTHSVRDSYTQRRLADLGFDVINTACPTMWELPDEPPVGDRPGTVVLTLTDYNKDVSEDKWLIETVSRYYEEVVIWPQSSRDVDYAKSLDSRATLADTGLAAYDDLLARGVDYVGTRLHGGVYALSKGSWSFISAVDNRAVEIGKDTNLPVARRGERDNIHAAIQARSGPSLTLPRENIERWRNQLRAGVATP